MICGCVGQFCKDISYSYDLYFLVYLRHDKLSELRVAPFEQLFNAFGSKLRWQLRSPYKKYIRFVFTAICLLGDACFICYLYLFYINWCSTRFPFHLMLASLNSTRWEPLLALLERMSWLCSDFSFSVVLIIVFLSL